MNAHAVTTTRRRAPVSPPLRDVVVTCLSCGCEERTTIETGRTVEGTRYAAIIAGAPLHRNGACYADCRCHAGQPERGPRRLQYHLETPRA